MVFLFAYGVETKSTQGAGPMYFSSLPRLIEVTVNASTEFAAWPNPRQ
jgi:hypothetical protein